MADSEVFLDLLKEPSEELRGSTYDEVIDVKAHHSNCLTALTGTSMHRINEMLEKLINQLRRQFRQTLDLVGSLLRKQEGMRTSASSSRKHVLLFCLKS